MNTRNIPSLDISNIPELARLVEEVKKTKKPRLLKKDREEVALLMPVDRTLKKKTEPTKADNDAFHAAAGSWSDVDIEQFKKDIFTSRKRSTRPTVEL